MVPCQNMPASSEQIHLVEIQGFNRLISKQSQGDRWVEARFERIQVS